MADWFEGKKNQSHPQTPAALPLFLQTRCDGRSPEVCELPSGAHLAREGPEAVAVTSRAHFLLWAVDLSIGPRPANEDVIRSASPAWHRPIAASASDVTFFFPPAVKMNDPGASHNIYSQRRSRILYIISRQRWRRGGNVIYVTQFNFKSMWEGLLTYCWTLYGWHTTDHLKAALVIISLCNLIMAVQRKGWEGHLIKHPVFTSFLPIDIETKTIGVARETSRIYFPTLHQVRTEQQQKPVFSFGAETTANISVPLTVNPIKSNVMYNSSFSLDQTSLRWNTNILRRLRSDKHIISSHQRDPSALFTVLCWYINVIITTGGDVSRGRNQFDHSIVVPETEQFYHFESLILVH